MARDIISKAVRTEFREWLVGFYLREVCDIFDAAGIVCDVSYEPSETGQRRSLVEQYYHSVDWKNPEQVKCVLSAYEYILINMAEDKLDKFKKLLLRDGFLFDGARILPVSDSIFPEDKLHDIANDLNLDVINDYVARLRGSVEDDPSLAIGTAKEMIECICKGIIHDCDAETNGKEDIPALVKLCLKSLNMAREDISSDKKGAEARKQIASGLAAACQGITELRNVYGTGHGHGPKAARAIARDARLAVGTAATIGVFLAEVNDAQRSLRERNEE